MNIEIPTDAARRASDLLAALGNEKRLMILCQLAAGERSVGEIAPAIGISQSALSQHLARLRHDGIVQTRRASQTIYYSLASPEAQRVIETLYGLFCAVPAASRTAAEQPACQPPAPIRSSL